MKQITLDTKQSQSRNDQELFFFFAKIRNIRFKYCYLSGTFGTKHHQGSTLRQLEMPVQRIFLLCEEHLPLATSASSDGPAPAAGGTEMLGETGEHGSPSLGTSLWTGKDSLPAQRDRSPPKHLHSGSLHPGSPPQAGLQLHQGYQTWLGLTSCSEHLKGKRELDKHHCVSHICRCKHSI